MTKPARKFVVLSLVPVLIFLLQFLAFTSNQPKDKHYELENCTSILVGKLASEDGSTMTSHSCDSNTDRTWINVVPHKTNKPRNMCKVYFQAKRSKGPDYPDRLDIG